MNLTPMRDMAPMPPTLATPPPPEAPPHGPAPRRHPLGVRRSDAPARCSPQIRQIGPGNRPICGMALEPVVATGLTGDSAELRDMTRRLWIGLVLALPVVELEMGGHLAGLNHVVPLQASNGIQPPPPPSALHDARRPVTAPG